MKKPYILLISLCLLGLSGCSEETDYTYIGANYVQIQTNDATNIKINSNKVITINVLTATSSEQDENLEFELIDSKGAASNALRIDQNPVILKAGEKTASFQISSNHPDNFTETQILTLRLKSSTDSRMASFNEIKLQVRPNPTIEDLTDEQKAFIENYKTLYGFDLNELLGEVDCHVKIVFSEDDVLSGLVPSRVREFDETSILTLSQAATADCPVLKMSDNPMGLNDFFYEWLMKCTVEDTEFWNTPDVPGHVEFLEAIHFNRDTETFSSSLDNIRLNVEEHTIDYMSTYACDSWGNETFNIPFDYDFSAQNRWQVKIDNDESLTIKEGDSENTYPVSELLGAYTCHLNAKWILGTNDLSESEDYSGYYDFEQRTLTFSYPWNITTVGAVSLSEDVMISITYSF